MTFHEFEVKENELKKVAETNDTAKGLMSLLTIRRRGLLPGDTLEFKQVKSELAKANVPVDDNDLYAAFEKLQQLQLGSIIHGKKGNGNKFKIKYDLKAYAHKAFDPAIAEKLRKDSGRWEQVVRRTKEEVNGKKTKGKRGRPKGAKNKVSHPKALKIAQDRRYLLLPLSDNRNVEIFIPNNLNANEAALLNLTISELSGSTA